MAALLHPEHFNSPLHGHRSGTPRRPLVAVVNGSTHPVDHGDHEQLSDNPFEALDIKAIVRLVAVGLVVSICIAVGSLLVRQPVPQRAADLSGVPSSVVVQPGDSLWSIASGLRLDQDIRITVDRLAARNHGSVVHVGQRIEIPSDLLK